MTTPSLRPLSFGEILDGAFTLYRRNFLRFVGTSALLVAGLFVATVLLVALGLLATSVMPGAMKLITLVPVGLCVLMLATVPWSTLAWQAARSYEGKPLPLGDSLGVAFYGALRLIGCCSAGVGAVVGVTYLVSRLAGPFIGEMGVAGTVVAVLGWLALCLCVGALLFAVMPAVLLEDRGAIGAIVRSVRLARGDVPRIAALLLVAWVIVYLPSLASLALLGGMAQLADPAAAAAPALLLGFALERLISIIITILTLPFLPSVLVLLYYDRRVRTEALDVELAATQLKLASA